MNTYTLTDACERIAVRVRLLPGESRADAEMRAAAKLSRKNGHRYICNGGWWYRQTTKNGYFCTDAAACFDRNPLDGSWA